MIIKTEKDIPPTNIYIYIYIYFIHSTPKPHTLSVVTLILYKQIHHKHSIPACLSVCTLEIQ